MPQTVIVDASEILNEAQIREENWTIMRLSKHLSDSDSCLQWCARRGLLRNSVLCVLCNIPTSFIKSNQPKDGRVWRCKVCRGKVSVRDGSLFQRSKITILQILLIIYHWAREIPQKIAGDEAEASIGTLVDWFNFCKGECANWLYRNPIQIGGFDEDGQPLVVEIDESKFSGGKYSDDHQVFGGIERQSGKCFLVVLNDQNAESLEGTILKHILPGTHIISNRWRDYSDLENLKNGVYTHSAGKRKRNFVDPDDSEIHTQNMQNLWSRIKRKLRIQSGTTINQFPKFLQEFIWRSANPRENVFSSILVSLSETFPIKDECATLLYRNPIQIGGFNEDGQPMVVEIDGSKFSGGKFSGDLQVFGASKDNPENVSSSLNDQTAETLDTKTHPSENSHHFQPITRLF